MGTRNNAFMGTEKGFGRDHCDVGLALRMQQVEESCPNKSFMPMPHHSSHHQLSSSSSSCCGDGFDGGACGGGPIVCNTSNQVPCTGDIYDVVGAASASASAAAAGVFKSLHHHPFSADPSFPNNCSGEMAAPVNARAPFTAAQWQELERQTMIYKYMTASEPVPPDLPIPLTRNPSNVIKGSLELGFSGNSSDPEPWRCRRTDGKKWRCSRDVAPDQKYCERHSHKSRPRSRKPVELPNHSVNNNDHKPHTHNMASDKQPHQNPHFITDAHLLTSSFDQPRCLEWFIKGETTVPFAGNSNPEWQQFQTQGTKYGGNVSEYQQQYYKDHRLNLQAQHLNEQFSPDFASLGGASNLNQTHSQETRSFIDAWSTAEREVAELDGFGSKRPLCSNEKLPLSSLTLSMSGGSGNNQEEDDENSQMGAFDIMGLAVENVRALRPQMANPVSWMGSPPGGPLAEALCLGIASSQSSSTSNCSKST
ncbi:WRC domain - like 4 [Theobroma cacao]|nr:WRC domain - like 4 [Theobroma cacao]